MKYAYLFLLTVAIFFIGSCKDDDINLDPCELEGVVPVSAAFTTSNETGWQDSTRRFVADTFLNYSIIIFTAEQEAASYQWKVGSDPRVFDSKEFTLTFTGIIGTIDVQLIIENTPNLDCFPNDDGRDTLNKQIHLVEKMDSPMLGIYKGVVSSAPNDTFNIDIHTFPPYNETNNINNFPNGCNRDEEERIDFFLGYRYIMFGYPGNYVECPKPQGWGTLDLNGIVTLEYSLWNTNIQQHVSDTFIGKKIN